MEPNNVIMGDSTGVELPRMQPDETDLSGIKNKVKYSKSKEFKEIQEWCQTRIDFYNRLLPNGLEIGMDITPTSEDWRVANRVNGELRALMNVYETAKDIVDGLPTA